MGGGQGGLEVEEDGEDGEDEDYVGEDGV